MMPCSDGQINYNDARIAEKRIYLEGIICALLTELDKLGPTGDLIIKRAIINGKVDINKFWEDHKTKDEIRMKTVLMKYSNHEVDILKRILKS